jgi:hypothetical protein
MNAQALARSTVYGKRNVRDAATSLASSGFVYSHSIGNENLFEASPRWLDFLSIDRLPESKDWPRLFRAFRQIIRWLSDPANRDLSDYMLLSGARTLIEEVENDLPLAEIGGATKDFAGFESFVRDFLSVAR